MLPYAGKAKKLVISIDVGTTFTATSFCILQPGNIPKFEEVSGPGLGSKNVC